MSTPVPQSMFSREDADDFEATMQDRKRQVHFDGVDQDAMQQQQQQQQHEHAFYQQQQIDVPMPAPEPESALRSESFGATMIPSIARGMRASDADADKPKSPENKPDELDSLRRMSKWAIIVAVVALIAAAVALYVLFGARATAAADSLKSTAAASQSRVSGGAFPHPHAQSAVNSYYRAVIDT